jgi:hypothetical protein
MRRHAGLVAAVPLAAGLVCLLAVFCGRPSEEARVRELIERAAARAEKRDVRGLMDLFAPDYRDFEGRDKAGTVSLITDYLARYRGVVVHVLGVEAGPIAADGRAEVTCEVALSHGAAEILRKLIRVGSEYYRFRFELGRDGGGEWRFAYAEWEQVDLADLFPESLAILKKLFPEL